MNKLFKSVAWVKVYFNSLASYLGILNFLLLLLTFKSLYHINVSAFIVVPAALVVGGIVGYLDYRYVQTQQNIIYNQVNDIKKDLEEIKTILRDKQ